MSNQFDTVVFDLDGTLLNTLEDMTASTNYALSACGLPLRSIEEVRSFVGNGIPKLVQRAVPKGSSSETVQRVLSVFREHYSAHSSDRTRPYEGIPELMGRLHDSGMKIAVVSNKPDAAVQELCGRFFQGSFDYAVGAREGVPKKPSPEPVFRALEAIGSFPASSVYVGDSEVDIATARNASMACISVTWGFRSAELLLESGADPLTDTVDALERAIRG